jgi:hypothetical protein
VSDRRTSAQHGRRGSHARLSATGRHPGLRRQAGRWLRQPDHLPHLPRVGAPRTIRGKIACLLAAPLAALTTLWAMDAAQTAEGIHARAQLQQLNAAMHTPTDDLISALQRERIAVARFLGGTPGTAEPGTKQTESYTRSNAAADAFSTGAAASVGAAAGLGAGMTSRINTLLADLAGLPALRDREKHRQVTSSAAGADYTKTIDDALRIDDGLAAALDRGRPDGDGR